MAILWIACAGVGLCLVLIAALAFIGKRREAKIQSQIRALAAKMIDSSARPAIEAEIPLSTPVSRFKMPANVRPAEAELLSKVSAATRN